MAEPFIGEIRLFGFNFPPRGWATCDGQLLPISQNTALFSLLGTYYGGDGRVTFGLPDLRGRVPIHFGQGPGLTPHDLGQVGGSETTLLQVTQLPPHTHPQTQPCSTDDGTAGSPKSNYPGSVANPIYATTTNASMGAATTGPAGGGQPVPTVPPFLVMNYCIALQGIFPSRN